MNRRDFFKSTGALAVAAALPAVKPQGFMLGAALADNAALCAAPRVFVVRASYSEDQFLCQLTATGLRE